MREKDSPSTARLSRQEKTTKYRAELPLSKRDTPAEDCADSLAAQGLFNGPQSIIVSLRTDK